VGLVIKTVWLPYQRQKGSHFSSRLNTGNEGAFWVNDDKLSHAWKPATQNARSTMVVRRALGMSSLDVLPMSHSNIAKHDKNKQKGSIQYCLEDPKNLSWKTMPSFTDVHSDDSSKWTASRTDNWSSVRLL